MAPKAQWVLKKGYDWPGLPNVDSYAEGFCAGNEFLIVSPDERYRGTVVDYGREAAWPTPDEP